jgi:hypothetical protein
VGSGSQRWPHRNVRKDRRRHAGRHEGKADAVIRLLRGENLDELSRELRVEATQAAGVARRVPRRRY